MLLAADWALARLLATVLSLRLWADMAEPAMSKILSIDITPLPEWHCPGWQSGRSETENWPGRPRRCGCSGQTPAGFPPCCHRRSEERRVGKECRGRGWEERGRKNRGGGEA